MNLYPRPHSPMRRLRDLRDRLRPPQHPARVEPTPYLDDESLALLKDGLESCSAYLEYGSGGSTLLAAQTGKQVFSVENDLAFAAAVCASLSPQAHVELTTVDLGRVRAWAVPVNLRPTSRNVARWSEYPEAPWRAVDSAHGPTPDFVLVDGRFRVASAATSLGRLRGVNNARVMVDDYTVRPEYWVLEAMGELCGIHGRAAIFAPGEVKGSRLQTWIKEYQRDWR